MEQLTELTEGLLTTDETARLFLAILVDGPETEENVMRVVAWAKDIRTGQLVLDCVLEGSFGVRWSEEAEDVEIHTLNADERRQIAKQLAKGQSAVAPQD